MGTLILIFNVNVTLLSHFPRHTPYSSFTPVHGRMGNRFARACISSRLTKPANTKLETHTRRVEISTIMVVEHKWSHTYLDAIIVEFCTQLRLRWRILVWLPRSTLVPDYDAGGFSTLDGTI